MYAQITTRCNMSCEHCGMNCTAQGEDMSFDNFKLICDETGYIMIGGGEPTIHPQFEKFLLYAIGHCEHVTIITNGSMTDTSLALAAINSDDFCAYLSQDPYHDPIDEKVVKAFKNQNQIRNTSRQLINAGRCDFGKSDKCICDGDPFVRPNGDIHQCGCKDSPKVGHVSDGYPEPMEGSDEEWICHKELKKSSSKS